MSGTEIIKATPETRALCLLIHAKALADQRDRLAVAPVRGDDPRLVEFWERMDGIANDYEFCSVYDDIKKAMRGPQVRVGQESEYEVTFDISFRVTLTVTASDPDDARERADDNLTYHEMSDAIRYGGYEIDDWTVDPV